MRLRGFWLSINAASMKCTQKGVSVWRAPGRHHSALESNLKHVCHAVRTSNQSLETISIWVKRIQMLVKMIQQIFQKVMTTMAQIKMMMSTMAIRMRLMMKRKTKKTIVKIIKITILGTLMNQKLSIRLVTSQILLLLRKILMEKNWAQKLALHRRKLSHGEPMLRESPNLNQFQPLPSCFLSLFPF